MSRTSSHTQRNRQPPPTAKQASEEQLHVASRIGESQAIPSDIKIKIQQVAAIVPDKSEDEICIMLHDNNFDPEATITALLDNDSGDVKNEWTTKKSKNKKKVTQPPTGKAPTTDTIIAPGDSHTPGDREGTRSYGGTSKAASKSTRESYGGSVSVERVDREQRSNKSYSRNSSRGFRGSSGDRGRLRRRRGGGFRGFSSRDHDRGRSGGSGSDNVSYHLPPSSQPSVPSTEATWDDETTFSSNQNDDSVLPTTTTTSTEANWGQDEHHGITSAPGIPSSEQVSSAPSLSVFPDAMVPPLGTEGEEIRVSSSSPLINTTIPPSQQQTAVLDNRLIQQLMAQEISGAIPVSSSSQLRVKFSDDLPTSQSSSQKLKSSKIRKAMRSEIPSDPVQMPRAMGSLEAQFGNLGIDFIGMNGANNEADDVHSMTQAIAQQQQVDNDMTATSFPQHLGQLSGSNVDQLTHTTASNNPLLDSVTAAVYTSQQHFVDDPSIISITSSTIMGNTNSRQSFHHEETPPSKIEPPPGLTHPSKLQQQANKDAAAKANELLQAPMSLSVASQQSEPRTSSYGQTSNETTTIVLSQQDNLLSTIATHQPPPLGTVVGGHKRNSSLQTEEHEVLSTESSSVLSGRSHDLTAHPQDHPMLGKTSSGPPALDMSRVGSGSMPIPPSSLPPSSRIDSLSSSREPSSSQMELPVSRIEPPSVSQLVFSDKGMGQVSNGLLMTPMSTAVSMTNAPMTAVSMGYSNVGVTSRTGVSHSGPQNKHAVPPGMMYPAAAMMPQYPFVAYFPPSSDSMMATGMMRDHTTSNYPPADAKYGREISSPVGSTHGQQSQQAAAQAQQQGLQQSQGVHPFMNAAAIPYGNMFYANSAMLPSLYPTLGLPGFSPSMPPKAGAAGGSYPTGAVSTYQSMGAAGGFNMSGGYEEMNATVNHDYNKYMNPQTGKLSVGGNAVASTNSDMGAASSFKHQQPPFDTTKNYGYNMPMGGSAGGYMGGFFPTMAMHPAAVPSLIPTPTDVNQPRQPVQKQHKPYIGSVF